MKKLIVSGCAVLATVAALATTTVESDNTFGVLKVADNSQKEIIVGIPWEAVGGGAINVTNLVLASGLEKDDALLWYDNGINAYKGWVVDTDTQTATKYWKATDTIKVGTKSVSVSTAAPTTLARGYAILIQRANPESSTIYISGQYNSAAADALTIPGPPTGTANYFQVWTPIAYPKAEVWNLNSSTWSGVDANDKIKTGPGVEYARSEGKWGKVKTTNATVLGVLSTVRTIDTSDATIPAGQGGWYIREGKGALTLTF